MLCCRTEQVPIELDISAIEEYVIIIIVCFLSLMLFVVLLCSVAAYVVGGVLLWVICVFRRVDVVCGSVVHTVAILRSVLCVICSLLMFVYDASGDHIIVEMYSSMGLVIACMFRVSFPFVFASSSLTETTFIAAY